MHQIPNAFALHDLMSVACDVYRGWLHLSLLAPLGISLNVQSSSDLFCVGELDENERNLCDV